MNLSEILTDLSGGMTRKEIIGIIIKKIGRGHSLKKFIIKLSFCVSKIKKKEIKKGKKLCSCHSLFGQGKWVVGIHVIHVINLT